MLGRRAAAQLYPTGLGMQGVAGPTCGSTAVPYRTWYAGGCWADVRQHSCTLQDLVCRGLLGRGAAAQLYPTGLGKPGVAGPRCGSTAVPYRTWYAGGCWAEVRQHSCTLQDLVCRGLLGRGAAAQLYLTGLGMQGVAEPRCGSTAVPYRTWYAGGCWAEVRQHSCTLQDLVCRGLLGRGAAAQLYPTGLGMQGVAGPRCGSTAVPYRTWYAGGCWAEVRQHSCTLQDLVCRGLLGRGAAAQLYPTGLDMQGVAGPTCDSAAGTIQDLLCRGSLGRRATAQPVPYRTWYVGGSLGRGAAALPVPYRTRYAGARWAEVGKRSQYHTGLGMQGVAGSSFRLFKFLIKD